MKQTTDNAQIPESCLASVSGSVTEKDLMIGNLVFLPSGIVYAVDIVYKNYAMLKYWRAIPITEKWLKFLGFIKDEQINLIRLNSTYGTITIYPEKNKFKILGAINGYCFSTYEIKYVHQLQNLYRSLTGFDLQLVDLTDR